MKKPNTILQESYYYPLFEHMADNHGLTLLDSEMQEIERVVLGLKIYGTGMEWIIKFVSRQMSIPSLEILTNKRRNGMLVLARWFVWRLATDSYHTNGEIAKYFGMSHSTITHGLRALRDEVETNNLIRKQFEAMQKEFQSARQTDDVCGLPTGNKVQPTTSQARG